MSNENAFDYPTGRLARVPTIEYPLPVRGSIDTAVGKISEEEDQDEYS